jgi:hypothetical protein
MAPENPADKIATKPSESVLWARLIRPVVFELVETTQLVLARLGIGNPEPAPATLP